MSAASLAPSHVTYGKHVGDSVGGMLGLLLLTEHTQVVGSELARQLAGVSLQIFMAACSSANMTGFNMCQCSSASQTSSTMRLCNSCLKRSWSHIVPRPLTAQPAPCAGGQPSRPLAQQGARAQSCQWHVPQHPLWYHTLTACSATLQPPAGPIEAVHKVAAVQLWQFNVRFCDGACKDVMPGAPHRSGRSARAHTHAGLALAQQGTHQVPVPCCMPRP